MTVNAGLIAQETFGYKLVHLSPCIGTEVHGIDLGDNLSDEVIQFLMDLLVKRKVIFFRDQRITEKQHVDFARRFGELEVHPFIPHHEAYPEIIFLDNDRQRPPTINVWHSDVTWREVPSLGSVLRAREVPEVGGDTLFADMEAAYDSLDAETKEQIDGLYAIHDNALFLNQLKNQGASEAEIEAQRKQYPPSRHPVVRTHPVTKRKSIYVNKTFTRTIEAMPENEARTLLDKLYLTAWIPDHQCRFRWQKNSFAFWDNRAAQHYATADYWPEIRKMERVTVIGDRPASSMS
ncbi:MAG: TauD/TfdA family dioxygenase [Pseudomonadales bacterium]|nr:TauD/TfdA family dioxygenase [Pseudomonadales bacterium]